ncbi:MAG: protein-tyrosine-phosphatase [Planctomycetota bacterium]
MPRLMLALIIVISVIGSAVAFGQSERHTMYPKIERYLQQRTAEFSQISSERRELLQDLASYVAKRIDAGKPVRLNFICTHNSRRSHMSQIWAATAAAHFGIEDVHTYSGGTEWTAFNPRAVAAMQRVGFDVARTTDDDNPIYHVRFSGKAVPMTCFSKIFDGSPNPRTDFGAVMVCSSADEDCPVVQGADYRIGITYEDPKAFDGTSREAEAYDERCRQISRELLYAFSVAQEMIGG